jgi:hypothetical protein
MIELSLPHKIAKTTREGMYLVLKRLLRRKWSLLVLMELQVLGCIHPSLGVATTGCWARSAHHMGTPGAGIDMPVCWVRTACMAANSNKIKGSWFLSQNPRLKKFIWKQKKIKVINGQQSCFERETRHFKSIRNFWPYWIISTTNVYLPKKHNTEKQ